MTASSCPSCGAPVTPEVVDGIVRDEHRCEVRSMLDAIATEHAEFWLQHRAGGFKP